jgi:hypothetical protein
MHENVVLERPAPRQGEHAHRQDITPRTLEIELECFKGLKDACPIGVPELGRVVRAWILWLKEARFL